MHTDPPVAELVAEPLEHHGLVGRQGAGRRLLLGQIGEQVVGGELVQAVGPQPLPRLVGGEPAQLTDEPTEGPAQLQRPRG